MIARLLLPALLMATWSVAGAQDTLIAVYGTVRDYITREPVPDALVMVTDMQHADKRITTLTTGLGRYELAIPEEGAYHVVYTRAGYYPKSVVIDATGPSPEEWEGGYGMNIDIVLLPEVEDMDLSFGGEPFGRAGFVRESGHFEWDVAYTEGMQQRIREQVEAYRKRMGIVPEPSNSKQ